MIPLRDLNFLISVIFNLGLGIFVFLRGKREKANQIFFVLTVSAISWMLSLLLYKTIDSPELILWIGRINFATVLPLLYYLFKLTLIFPRETVSVPKKLKTTLSYWILIFTLLTAFTPLVGKEEIITGPGQRETIFGPLIFFYLLHYFFFSVLVIIILFHKIRKSKNEEEKAQIIYLLIGLSVALCWGISTTVIASLIGFSGLSDYAPLSIIFFSGFVATAIIKHHLFKIRVILVELLVAVIALVLFLQALMAESLGTRVVNWGVFGLFCVFGYQLIRSTLWEIRRREEMERVARDLEKAYRDLKVLDRAKTEFISIASHQLRTPLTALKGYLSLIREGTYGKTPKTMNKPVNNMYVSTERLIGLVNNLLNISRIEAGKTKLEIEKFSLEDIINSVVEELKNLAKKKELYIDWNKPDKELPKILADKNKIRQAVLNLIDNAIRYTEEGGVTIDYEVKDDVCRLTVSDTGPGMTQEEMSHLFQSFRRGAVGQKTWTGGTGLGLYIAKKYVDMHKGKIWAESKGKNKGSTFYLELPTN